MSIQQNRITARRYVEEWMSGGSLDLVDELVVTRWLARGRHSGELLGAPATGKELTTTAIVIDRYRDGKIVERWPIRTISGFCGNSASCPAHNPAPARNQRREPPGPTGR